MTAPRSSSTRRTATADPRARGAARVASPRLLATVATALVLAAGVAVADTGSGARFGSVPIPGGSYDAFYAVAGEIEAVVAPFSIDVTPVTNARYLAFVTAEPLYRRGAIPALFADPGYLRHWAGPLDLGDADPDAPVVNVSWFAALAYCEAQGRRLPSEAEWELVGRASAHAFDARGEAGWNDEVLARTTATSTGPVGLGTPNAYGAYDMHRLFEWVDDAQASITTQDGRAEGDTLIAKVCGGAADGAADRRDYAAFLRYAVRAGQDASSVTPHLGFRCAGPQGEGSP
jgi:formylglycine-generating enzyme